MKTDQLQATAARNGRGTVVTYETSGATAREPADDSTSDTGDESLNNERKEKQLWKVDTDRMMLSQVQDKDVAQQIQQRLYLLCAFPIEKLRHLVPQQSADAVTHGWGR